MKIKRIIAAALAATLLGSMASCSFFSDAKRNKTITAQSNGVKYSLTIPDDWEEMPGRLMDNALLEAGSTEREEYLLLMEESKARLQMTLEEYTEIVKRKATEAIERDAAAEETESLTVGGHAAYCVPVSGVVRDVQVQYWIYAIDCGEVFLRVVSWTLASRTEETAQRFRDVVLSLKAA